MINLDVVETVRHLEQSVDFHRNEFFVYFEGTLQMILVQKVAIV